MLYIENNTTASQAIRIPAKGVDLTGYTFKLVGILDRKEYTPFSSFTASVDGMYIKIAGTLASALPVGEYEYRLYSGTDLCANGLLQVGDYSHNPTEYTKTIEYEQY